MQGSSAASSSSSHQRLSNAAGTSPYEIAKSSLLSRLRVEAGSTLLNCKKYGGDINKNNGVVPLVYKFPIFGNVKNHKAFLNPEILEHFLPFVFDLSFSRMMCVCPHWFLTLYTFIVDKWARSIADKFAKTYETYLLTSNVIISVQPVYTDNSSVRIDLILYAEVLPAARGSCLELQYFGNYLQDPAIAAESIDCVGSARGRLSRQNFRSVGSTALASMFGGSFRCEVLRKGSKRRVWMRKDSCRFHGDEILVAEMANVPQVCVGDTLEIAFNVASAFAIVDPLSVEWAPVKLVTDRDDPPRKYGAAIEVNEDDRTWFDYDTYIQRAPERVKKLDCFGPQWRLKKLVCCGIDIVIAKYIFDAETPGDVTKASNHLGLQVVVVPKNQKIIVPLKRLGLEHDRFSQHQMRQGDELALYVLEGGVHNLR